MATEDGAMDFVELAQRVKNKKKAKTEAAALATVEAEKAATTEKLRIGKAGNQSLRAKLGLAPAGGSGVQALEPGVKPGVSQRVASKGGVVSKIFKRFKKVGSPASNTTDQIGTGTIDPSKLPQMGAIQQPGVTDPAEEERKRRAALAAAGGPKTILG